MACKLLVFTFTDKPEHPGAERLRRSAKYWGWDLKWVKMPSFDPLFRFQQLAQLDALRQYEPDFFLYLDAWDTIFCGPKQELRFEKGVVCFCGDTILGEWQDKRFAVKMMKELYPPCKFDGFPYVNDGVIWGDTKVYMELAADYLQNYEGILNQDYFNQRYAYENSLRRSRLRVDQEASQVINVMGLLARTVDRGPNGRLIYKPFNTRPVILHSPGTRLGQPLAPMPKWMEEEYASED